MKAFIAKILGRFGYSLTRHSSLAALNAAAARGRDLDFLAAMPPAHVAELLALLPQSQSQLRQDLFVLSELGFKRGGHFVEFGAASGKELSNTWLLEKQFGWSGILAEPAKCWHERLAANRNCAVEHRCVWKSTGDRLDFSEAREAEISTLTLFKEGDQHAVARRASRRYQVETISLADLLAAHAGPAQPDYLSIDTEGSEFEILEAFDFQLHPFKVITCEHNFTPAREKIHALLTAAGYVRKYEKISDFDDWYVRI
ncbi:MAG: FkbM family methyltransferase [Verrucomicrobia bacterium]|jgi:FkbM family methyltransferase|nr:FkbM family methyltransferase [Verrucomicrobiota bacterium]